MGMPPPPMGGPLPPAMPPAPPPMASGMAPDMALGAAPPPSEGTLLLMVAEEFETASDEDLKKFLSEAPADEIKHLLRALELANPELVDRFQGLLAEITDPGPKYPKDYPRWFKRPPKPRPGEVESMVGIDEGEYTDYRDRVQRTMEWITQMRYGTFSRQKKTDEPWFSAALSADHNARSFLVGGITPKYRKRPLNRAMEADAQKCEDFLGYCRQQHEIQHAESFNGELGIDEAKYLDTHGMLVTKVMMDPADESFPFILELMDPTTCFPVPGGRHGLQRLTRRYTTTVAKALDAFDTDGSLIGKITKTRNDTDGREVRRSLHSEVEVYEYYDRWWMYVAVDGVPCVNAAHRYGWVPFVVTPGAWGLPLSMADPLHEGAVLSDKTAAQHVTKWANRCVGPLYYQLRAHAQLEAIMGQYATAVRRSNSPPWERKRSLMANNSAPPAIKLDDDHQNITQLDEEELVPMNLGPAPQMAQPLVADLTRSFGMTMLPAAQYGAEPGANATGNAIEQLTENGRVILTGHVKAAERHHAAVGKRLLQMVRDWGDILGEDGQRGVIVTPHRPDRVNPDELSFEMTPEVVKRAGIDTLVSMTNIQLSGLLQLGNAVSIWTGNKMMSRREAIEMRQNFDPQGVFDEINEEDAQMDPRLRDLVILESLMRRGGAKLPPDWLGNKWEQLVFEAKAQQQGAGPGGPPGMGGGPNTSAMNLAGMGMGPGTGGGPVGRPPGTGLPDGVTGIPTAPPPPPMPGM